MAGHGDQRAEPFGPGLLAGEIANGFFVLARSAAGAERRRRR